MKHDLRLETGRDKAKSLKSTRDKKGRPVTSKVEFAAFD